MKLRIPKPIQLACVFVLGLTAALSTAVSAAERERRIQLSQKSEVQFRVGVLGVFKKSGRFKDMRGDIVIAPKGAIVQASIQVNSAEMAKRSDRELLLGNSYFYAEKYPEIVFKSTRFDADLLQRGGEISGTITVRGISHKQSFAVSTEPSCTQADKLLCPFHAKGSLKRSRFGMTARRAFVSDEVDLDLVFYARNAEPASAMKN